MLGGTQLARRFLEAARANELLAAKLQDTKDIQNKGWVHLTPLAMVQKLLTKARANEDEHARRHLEAIHDRLEQPSIVVKPAEGPGSDRRRH